MQANVQEWWRRFISLNCTTSTSLWSSNAIIKVHFFLAKEMDYSARTKHIDVRHQFVRECGINSFVSVERKVGSGRQVNIMTKKKDEALKKLFDNKDGMSLRDAG